MLVIGNYNEPGSGIQQGELKAMYMFYNVHVFNEFLVVNVPFHSLLKT